MFTMLFIEALLWAYMQTRYSELYAVANTGTKDSYFVGHHDPTAHHDRCALVGIYLIVSRLSASKCNHLILAASSTAYFSPSRVATACYHGWD